MRCVEICSFFSYFRLNIYSYKELDNRAYYRCLHLLFSSSPCRFDGLRVDSAVMQIDKVQSMVELTVITLLFQLTYSAHASLATIESGKMCCWMSGSNVAIVRLEMNMIVILLIHISTIPKTHCAGLVQYLCAPMFL